MSLLDALTDDRSPILFRVVSRVKNRVWYPDLGYLCREMRLPIALFENLRVTCVAVTVSIAKRLPTMVCVLFEKKSPSKCRKIVKNTENQKRKKKTEKKGRKSDHLRADDISNRV